MGLLRGWRRSAAVLSFALFGVAAHTGCYDTGDGSPPPLKSFYFPVGLAVSHGGTVLYAVNSNFDLQFNGGTLQSYDLQQIRRDAVVKIKHPLGNCPDPFATTSERTEPLGRTCAPPVDSGKYIRDSAIIGAFATDLLLSPVPADLIEGVAKVHADDPPSTPEDSGTDRLFIPVRGDATLTWASVTRDDFVQNPSVRTRDAYAPFALNCGQGANRRCDAKHHVGEDPNETGNTRHLKLPGEPFGATISQDGTSIVMTHQNDSKSSLFSTGYSRVKAFNDQVPPGLQFIVDDVPIGGIGVVPVPHDPDAFLGARELPRPAFFQTSRAIAEVSLLRSYSDEEGGTNPTNLRPFLEYEAKFPITVSPSGLDSRGIAIDPTPRLSCKARVEAAGATQTVEDRDRQMQACARKPARVFIANRSPASLLIGDVGASTTSATAGTTYDPDKLTIHTTVPLSAGPSRVYLAPIVDVDGAYSLRVFVVCYDSSTIFVYDPDAGAVESVIQVAPGPAAMAFDPFSFDDVAKHVQVPLDDRDQHDSDVAGLRRYRFAYLASFTQSFMQVIDLDKPSAATYSRIVFNVGIPTTPKGS